MYFTSWDANVFLCMLSVFPEEVVRGMIKMVKKTHEDYVQEESLEYWSTLPDQGGTIELVGKANRSWWKKRKNLKEFSELWIWRSPERRRFFVVHYAGNGSLFNSLDLYLTDNYHRDSIQGKGTSKAGYWNPSEAWSYSILDRNLDTSEWSEDEEEEYFDMKEMQRRKYVSEWYENIHEGRYFLFFKENDIVPSDYLDRHRHNPLASIMKISDKDQVAQDLLTIDGGGLGEKPGNHIEHIDDLFP